jgi:hypothetical protein
MKAGFRSDGITFRVPWFRKFLMSWYLRNIKLTISHVIMIAACMQQALPGLAVGKHTSTNFKSP